MKPKPESDAKGLITVENIPQREDSTDIWVGSTLKVFYP